MDYEFSEDEKYFLSQLLIKLQNNQSIAEVPYVWMPDHFDKNRFQAAYFKSCILACPNLKISNSKYYLAIDFTEAQNISINAWVDRLRKQLKPKFDAEIELKLNQEARNRYQKAFNDRLEVIKFKKRSPIDVADGVDVVFVPAEDNWGRKKKPKISGDGNSWREQD